MAANYWASSQYLHWTFTKEELKKCRERIEQEHSSLVQKYPLHDLRLLSVYFRDLLVNKLAKRLNIRQQALATAQVYFRRYYTKVEIRRTNPYLVLATALYLACKMEECPQYIRVIFSEARNLLPDFNVHDASKIGECEFSLISEMHSQLILHHPYRTVTDLQEELQLERGEVEAASNIINDTYLTDLPLLYPPHVIGMAAIILALVGKPNQQSLEEPISAIAAVLTMQSTKPAADDTATMPKLTGFQTKLEKSLELMADSDINIEGVIDCIQELFSLYEIWDQYNKSSMIQHEIKDQLAHFVKG